MVVGVAFDVMIFHIFPAHRFKLALIAETDLVNGQQMGSPRVASGQGQAAMGAQESVMFVCRS